MGFGGLPVLAGTCFGGLLGVVGRGGGGWVSIYLRRLLLVPFLNKEFNIVDGGGGGGGGGDWDDADVSCNRLLLLPVLKMLLKIELGGGGRLAVETEWTRFLLLLILKKFCNSFLDGGGGGGGGGTDGVDDDASTVGGEEF